MFSHLSRNITFQRKILSSMSTALETSAREIVQPKESGVLSKTPGLMASWIPQNIHQRTDGTVPVYGFQNPRPYARAALQISWKAQHSSTSFREGASDRC